MYQPAEELPEPQEWKHMYVCIHMMAYIMAYVSKCVCIYV